MESVYRKKRDLTVCGVGFCPTTRAELVNEIFSMPVSPVSAAVAFCGVPGVVSIKEDAQLAQIISECSFVAMDGMPIVKIALRKGFDCERCAGPDIMGAVFKESVIQGKTHYFYGGTDDGVLKQLAQNLRRSYPGIQIAGMYSPPFRPLAADEDERICDEINALHPNFLWVGIGAPKQEKWIWEHRGKIHGTVMLGVGAGFDFYAGSLARAPEWVKNAGFEWLFRLCKEPKRLWKRYILGGAKWIYYRAEAKIKGLDG